MSEWHRTDMIPPVADIYDEIGRPSPVLEGRPGFDRDFKFGEFYYCPDDDSIYHRTNEGYCRQIMTPDEIAEAKEGMPECRIVSCTSSASAPRNTGARSKSGATLT